MQLGSQTIKNSNESMFRSCIRWSVTTGKFTSNTGNANNMPILILNHMLQKTLYMSERPMHINTLHHQMIIKTVLLKQASHWYACILYYNVKFLAILLELPDNIWSHTLYLLVVCHVQFYDFHAIGVLARWFHSL